MNPYEITRCSPLRAVAALLLLCAIGHGQTPPDDGGGGKVLWLKEQLAAMPALNRTAAATEAGDSKSHASTPSIDSSSPSLVDRSNPTEFFNVALALANNRGTGGNGAPTGSVTTTLYALFAGVQKKSLIDPEFYREQRYLRRLSFTIGTAASDPVKDGTSTDSALYGVRLNVYDGTDLYAKRRNKDTILGEAQALLSQSISDQELSSLLLGLYQKQLAKTGVTETPLIAEKNLNATFLTPASIRAWISTLPECGKQRNQNHHEFESSCHLSRPS